MTENPSWPTMDKGTPQSQDAPWPTMPGANAPATQAAGNPLAVTPKSLAPEAMPGRQAAPDATTKPATVATPETGKAPDDVPASQVPCPSCGAQVWSYESFCESCGGTLTPTTPPPAASAAVEDDLNLGDETESMRTLDTDDISMSEPASRSCTACGGVVGPDGYCTMCGAKAVIARDHWTESPAAWVGGCTDRGQRHWRNEDAMALAADAEPGSRAILVVLDGVSSSQDSDRGSLAGARAARDSLLQIKLTGDPSAVDVTVAQALGTAATVANEAVIDTTDPTSTNAASATFVACVATGSKAWIGTLGDSRVYWIGDDPLHSELLSIDDSVAQQRIMLGADREEAENGPGGHAITKWLGRDAEDVSPRTSMHIPTGPGWLLACTDGLWNYASDAVQLAEVLHGRRAELDDPEDPTALAESLVAWANDQGGRDNITAALVRFAPAADITTPTAPTSDEGATATTQEA